MSLTDSPLGVLVILQVYRFARLPDWRQTLLLAAVFGLGMLTKMTLLNFLPVGLALVFVCGRRLGLTSALKRCAVFLLVATILGSYKYVENYAYYRNPFISNVDFSPAWYVDEHRSFRGWRSYVDMRVWKLFRTPQLSEQSKGAYPEMLYAEFWYEHVANSNFGRRRPLPWLARSIYVLALIPTAVFLLGFAVLAGRKAVLVRVYQTCGTNIEKATACTAVLIYVFCLLFLVAAVLKFPFWGVLQGRLLFPALFGGLIAFSAGVEVLAKRRPAALLFNICMLALFGLFVIYFAIEIPGALWDRVTSLM